MHCTRMSPQSHWRDVGMRAARSGIPLERVVTGKPSIDVLIEEGFRKVEAKIARKEPSA